jgi:hypothetical protein
MLDPVSQLFGDALSSARTSERLFAAISTLHPVTKAISDVQNADPDLGPEIARACELLQELLETLDRAFTVNNTKFEVAMERAARVANGPEGD